MGRHVIMRAMKCSQAALDLIWQEETGGDVYYDKTNECRADWPGGASGVTIGGFYDLGYVQPAEFRRDWGDKLTADELTSLAGCVGVKGFPAKALARELAPSMNVPEATARDVFINREIPKWTAIVAKLPNARWLSDDCFGVLVSLTMNRGNSFSLKGDRYREMRQILADMRASVFVDIPRQLRAMKRLWPEDGDLWNRREHEANLFSQGLGGST